MRTSLVWILWIVSCTRAPAPEQPIEHAQAEQSAVPAPPERTPRPSVCAFESLDALCEGWRAHRLLYEGSWVSEGCARGEARRTSGPFAEVLLLGVHTGYQAREGAMRERPLFGGTVRGPETDEPVTTQHLVVARVGAWWFPLITYEAEREGASQPGERLEWTLDDGGTQLSWQRERERAVLIVEAGKPMICNRPNECLGLCAFMPESEGEPAGYGI